MVVAIDIGNTNVKFGVFDGENLVYTFRMATSVKTSDEYWLTIKEMLRLNNIRPEDVIGAIISSVNPNLNYTFEHLIRVYFNVTPLIVGTGIKTGINVRYDNPKEVGADRIVNSVAAYKTYGGNLIIVDCGTATTFNVINSEGEFVGGAISFGLKSASESLSESAARLPKIDLASPPAAIGKSTLANMQSGIVFGFVGMVEHLVARLKAESSQDAKVIATGGISEIVKKNSSCIDVVDRTLTLRGLNIIFNLNVKR